MSPVNLDLFPARIDLLGGRTRRRTNLLEWERRPAELANAPAYWFSPYAESCGLDPWTLIDSIERLPKGDHFDVWFAVGQCLTVPGEAPVYVSESTYSQLRKEPT